MFLLFTLVLLVVAMGILASVYSVFFPFMQNLGTVNQYHVAYYGAVSSIERAELSLRYRLPGFVGSGGFTGTNTFFGPLSDYTPDIISGDKQGFWWTIDSRAKLISGTTTYSIPERGMGNIDPMLSTGDSKDYNQIGYVTLETFLLSYDNTTDPNDYYTGEKLPDYFSSDEAITGVFRLPPKIFSGFWGGTDPDHNLCQNGGYLNDCTADGDPDGDGVYDDVALSWSMEGIYSGNGFKIFPTTAIFYYSGMQIDEFNDNVIRESIINETGTINFTNSFTPILHGAGLDKHNVVAQDADYITGNFETILSNLNNYFSGLRISFGGANLFRTRTGTIYPYLEYQFTFPQPIADRFYTIEGHGRVGEYDVQIVIKKPTVYGTVGGDFTVIF